jgi:hypothetical protein
MTSPPRPSVGCGTCCSSSSRLPRVDGARAAPTDSGLRRDGASCWRDHPNCTSESNTVKTETILKDAHPRQIGGRSPVTCERVKRRSRGGLRAIATREAEDKQGAGERGRGRNPNPFHRPYGLRACGPCWSWEGNAIPGPTKHERDPKSKNGMSAWRMPVIARG